LFIPANVNFEEQKFEVEQMVGGVLQQIMESLVENTDEAGTADTESTTEG
jgi:hypothetical protein